MLYLDIQKDNIDALKNHDKVKRQILQIVYGKMKNESINKGLNAKELADADAFNIIRKTIKELEEERDLNQKVNRLEMVEELNTQIKILDAYLPQLMSEEQIRAEIAKLDDKKIPNVMKHFKANFNGLCDMGLVSKIAKEFN